MAPTPPRPPLTRSSAELAAQNDELQRRVLRFAVVRQELINTRDRLDRELARFERLHAFNSRALAIDSSRDFGETVAEAIVDVFEVELGAFWLVRDDGGLEAFCAGPAAAASLEAVGAWLAQRGGADAARLVTPELAPGVCGPLALSEALVASCKNAEGRVTGFLVAGTTAAQARQFDRLLPEHDQAFALFSQQVGSLLDNHQGRAIIARQVVALRETQEQHRQARLLAEGASRAKSAFLANMSHEIRTPMNGVLGMLQLLEDTNPSPEQAEYVRIAAQSATSLLSVLGDVLDLSKIEAGRVELERAPFDLRALVAEVIALFDVTAQTRGLSLTLQTAPLPRVLGDANRLRQVLVNLVGNAMKFTERGEVAVTVEEQAERFTFGVRDTGSGLDADTKARLFTPFMQADSSTTRRFGGTGLGLAISRQLVELMHGELQVESRPGAGARFWFTIPLPVVARSSEGELSAAQQVLPPSLSGRVLLVEDNLVGQAVARGMLKKAGLEVTVANHGREALACLECERFSLVLMDCQMPVLDGYETTAEWRRLERERGLPRTPIVALTANATADEERACRAAGMDEFLMKPLRREALIDRLARYLAGVSGS